VGNRFGSGELLSERCESHVCSGRVVWLGTCGQQVWIVRVVAGDLWVAGLDQESCSRRDVGHKFVLEELSLETCGQQV
jgi:hypothetical protein